MRAHIEQMIKHYREQSVNMEKPAKWRELALSSLAGWTAQLERFNNGNYYEVA